MATLEAIFAATLQILRTRERADLTTTRVAARAGVSVGTLYQYFPNKRALLHAVLQRHIEALAAAVEAAEQRLSGTPLLVMSDGLVEAFLDARTSDIDTSRAIYRLAADLDTTAVLTDVFERVRCAVNRMLASASDATIEDTDGVAQMICATLSGTTRTVLERSEPGALAILRTQLPIVCRAYLQMAASARPCER